MTTNDPDERTIRLKVTALVEVEFGLDPVGIYFGNIKKSHAETRKAEVQAKDMESIEITDVESSSGFIIAEVVETRKNKQRKLNIAVSLKPGLPIGKFNEKVTVRSNNKKIPQATLWISGNIQGDIVVTPNRVHFGNISPGPTHTRTITVNRPRRKDSKIEDLKIMKVEDKTSLVNTEINEVVKGEKYEIKVTLKKDLPEQRIMSTLNIYTNDPDESVIKIPISGFVKSKDKKEKSD